MNQESPNEDTSEAIDFIPVEGEMEHSPPDVYAGNLIEWAVERHASDLFFSDAENSMIVSVRRMGRIEQVARLARSYGRRLQGYLRVVGGSDAGDLLRPTEGRAAIKTPRGREVDLRLSTIPTLFGMDLAVRLFDRQVSVRRVQQLGMDAQEESTLLEMLDAAAGLILVAGPVASGKSSTLYASLRHLHNGAKKIHSIEDPVEYAIDGVMQSQVNLKQDLDFSDLLSTVMRHSPDVIMIGEIRDPKTATAAVRAGTSGQLVLATIHAKTAVDAIERMWHYGVSPPFLAAALNGVVCQRLVRRLCQDCRKEVEVSEPLSVSAAVAKRLGDQTPKLYTSQGCPACFNDGFVGLTCLSEILKVDDDLGNVIEQQKPPSTILNAAHESGMVSLADAAVLRIYRGEMTADDGSSAMTSPLLGQLARLARQG
ncbi:Type II secretion system protein E [Roseimaritima multifibrata]|uniref:Type II secretion system protein E n=1 Tax=Roseimaritima multifibrata TaxID=1930274 RepID=A0A517MNY4_9BACT|nr:ATPase, T2SS/T4P/T4SS family [Roseimaritima multifibrata]QDS96593.1 Type II secretion system protein E [Roseimaritima multifibrata]